MGKGNRGEDDPRFSKVFSDPRFRTVRKKDLKVKLDDRFNKKNLKEEFTLLKSKAKVDKYGRKIKHDEGLDVVNNLDKYYKDEKEEEEGEDSEESEESEESESDSEKVLANDPLAKARGLVDNDETSDEESDSSDEEVSEGSEEENVETEGERREEIPEQEPTRRIAAVNLDWDHLNSTDLFATFNSFLPRDGCIKSVIIYKSEYGKERIADEEENGPPREIFKQIEKEAELDEEEEEEEDDDDDDIDLEKASKKLVQENNGEEDGFDSSELRKYQLQRLRYYYAVIEFDSIDSAIEIYKKCDSTEYESSGNFFDLRYIPEDMEFEDGDIRDKCLKLPTKYQPIEFSTDSLRNSKPKLTWDETPIERVQILSKSFKEGELEDLDLKNYLASDSDEEDGEDNGGRDISKYKMLVGGGGKEAGDGDGDGEEEDDVDMEFTFTPGKKEANKEENKVEMRAIDKLREKEKERRKARKQKVKELKREAVEKRKKKNNKNRGEEVGDNGDNGDKGDKGEEVEHFSMKDVARLEKLRKKKGKHKGKRERAVEEELAARVAERDDLVVDSRFAEMVEGHAFVGGGRLLQRERKRRRGQS